MKKFISMFLALAMMMTCFAGITVSAEDVTQTYGYDNLNNESGELKIAFLGGSITQGAGDVSNKYAERYST